MQRLKDFLKRFPRHWITAFSAWASKIIVSLTQILCMRELLLYLGEDRYAVYIIAYSLAAWMPLSELSIGTSLQNFISHQRAKKQNYDTYIVSAFQIEILVFLLFSIVIVAVSPFVEDILFRKFTFIPDLKNIHIVFTVCFVSLIYAVSSSIYKVYYALHKGYVANILPAISSIISLILIVVFRRYAIGGQNIIYAVLMFLAPQAIIAFMVCIFYLRRYVAKFFSVDLVSIKEILKRAFKFYGVGIFTTFYINADYLIISQTLASKPNEIISYNVFTRVFFFFSFIYSSFLASVWPVLNELYHQGHIDEIKRMLKRYLAYGFILMSIGTVGIMMFAKTISSILAPGANVINGASFILLIGFYMIVKTWADTFAVFLQSINVLKIFWLFMPFQIIINVAAQFFLSKQYGVYGILFGLIISVITTSLWILPIKTKHVFAAHKT
ncbi:MAG: MATE family efflux transporter [Elusimicrobiota bacterium]|jgi:O-antigen/teichoic acid export membrane protein|nr:MATE family efflux transporter [Elusimicrobiota bacterium]